MKKIGCGIAAVLGLVACTNGAQPGGTDLGHTMKPADMASSGNGETVTITTMPFSVDPGQELFMCQDFANPFGGVDTDVQEIDSDMTPGSHHMLLFFKDNATDSGVAPCDPLQFAPLPYGAQSPHNSIAYPTGVGALIQGTQGFHMQMHYLNATQNALMAQVTITFHKSVPGTVTQHAGVFFFNNISGMNVPPSTTKDVTQTCTFPFDVNIMYATAHTHHFTNSFTALIGGTQQYATTSWDSSPFKDYQPPIHVPAGTPVQWTCNVTNPDASNPLTFGESALTNDMCIFDGQYYPVPAGTNPTIACMK